MKHSFESGVRSRESIKKTSNSELSASNARGFTLLEVMVAVSIMAMVLVTLMGLQGRTTQDVSIAEHITIATMLAKRTMVDNIMFKPRLPAEDEGVFPEEAYKDYTWKRTIAPTPLINIMEVRVAVLWKEGTRQETVELVSYE